jgi:hypothetical protein
MNKAMKIKLFFALCVLLLSLGTVSAEIIGIDATTEIQEDKQAIVRFSIVNNETNESLVLSSIDVLVFDKIISSKNVSQNIEPIGDLFDKISKNQTLTSQDILRFEKGTFSTTFYINSSQLGNPMVGDIIELKIKLSYILNGQERSVNETAEIKIVNPPPRGHRSAGWYVGDMHVHSEHSEHELFNDFIKGKWYPPFYPPSISENAQGAQTVGLDFIAITDHETDIGNGFCGSYLNPCLNEWDGHILPECQAASNPNFLVIRGEELGNLNTGHYNIIGNTIEYHTNTAGEPLINCYNWPIYFSEIRDQEPNPYFGFINHPYGEAFYGDSWDCWNLDFGGIEIQNGDWDYTDSKARNYPTTSTTDSWVEFLQDEVSVTPVGNGDAHSVAEIGTGRTYVYIDSLTQSEIIDGLNNGRTIVTSENGALVYFEVNGHRIGDSVILEEGDAPFINIRWISTSNPVTSITVYKNNVPIFGNSPLALPEAYGSDLNGIGNFVDTNEITSTTSYRVEARTSAGIKTYTNAIWVIPSGAPGGIDFTSANLDFVSKRAVIYNERRRG